MDQVLEVLKPRPAAGGRHPLEHATKEMEEVRWFFADRHIPKARVAKALGVSFGAIRLWWAGNVNYKRLAQLQALMDKIIAWENENGEKFYG